MSWVNLNDLIEMYCEEKKLLNSIESFQEFKLGEKIKELITNQEGINMTDQETTQNSAQEAQTSITTFPAATPEQLTTQADNIVSLYQAFGQALQKLDTAEVYKVRAFAHMDDGWLWIEKGLQQAQLNAQQVSTTKSGSIDDKSTTSSSTTSSTDDNNGASQTAA